MLVFSNKKNVQPDVSGGGGKMIKLKKIMLAVFRELARLWCERVEMINRSDLPKEYLPAQPPAMFAAYPDVVGVEEICSMLGGISKKLARKLLSNKKIESLLIGREYKTTKQDVIDYINKEKN